MWSGFQGEGIKTVLPNEAHAKITCRLVSNQRPEKIVKLVTAHVEKYTPPGVTATVSSEPIGGKPYTIPSDHSGQPGWWATFCGSSTAANPTACAAAAASPSLASFLTNWACTPSALALPCANQGAHAPDEFFRLSSFVRGQAAYCQLLHKFAEARSEEME